MTSQNSILLIDDDAKLLTALGNRLECEGYVVWTASSAAEAEAMLARNPIDVIICDNRMPGRSGLEFLGRIKRDYPSTIRIILSGSVTGSQAVQAMSRYGISRVLEKPCSFDKLQGVLEELLGTTTGA